MNIKIVAEKTFNLLKGFGYEVSSYNKEGDLVIDPMEATRFAVESPNILVRIDPLDKHLSLKTGAPGEAIEKIRPMLKELAQDYLLDFDYSVFDKQIKPKGEKLDVAKKSKEEQVMSEEMEILRKLAGLQENPLLDPPGSKFKFGQDKNQKLDFDEEDVREFYFEVGRLFGNDPDLKKGSPIAAQILMKAYELHKRNNEDPKSAVIQAKKAIQIKTGNQPDDQMVGLPYESEEDVTEQKPAVPYNKSTQADLDRRIQDAELDKEAMKGRPKSDEEEDEYDRYARHMDPIRKAQNKQSVKEASLGKMTGSRKSSYQPLADSVKIIVRHNKDVNEEVRGARSRNIHSILIQRGEEKFKMAENNLQAARAMARHLHNGGETFDEIGEAITDMAKEFGKLKEFVGYVRRSKLVNEENEEFVSLAIENINNIRTTFKRLSGVKSYSTAVESVKDYNNVELLQDDLDLESKFTETHFDDKVANAMDSLKAMTSRRRSFESKITKAIESESFAGIKDMISEDDLMEFESINQQLGHRVSSLGNTAKDETLSNYLHSISNKLNAGGQLSQFEYGAIKSCLLSAGQHNVTNAPMTASESYEAFMDRFV